MDGYTLPHVIQDVTPHFIAQSSYILPVAVRVARFETISPFANL